jgi:hypothetical protein
MPVFKIRVTAPDQEYPLMTSYDIDATNSHDAEIEAKEQFRAVYGMNDRKSETYVMHNEAIQQERLQYYRDHGLPDEIPS